MNCKRCHRKLRNSKSVKNGYGPVCWSKMLAAHPVVVGKTTHPQIDDENKSTTWTDMYGIIHILKSGN